MSSYSMIAKTGSASATKQDYLWFPGDPRPTTKFGVVLLHGASAPDQYTHASRYASVELAALIAMAGIPCVSVATGDLFGNNTAMTDINNAITYLAAQTGVPSTKVHLVGTSMGGGTAVRYAGLNPTKVASITGLIPMSNIDALYQANTLGMRAAIGTAWGVTYPTALPSDANLLSYGPAIDAANIPTTFYYDDADAAIAQADVIALAAACGGTTVEVPPDLGHTEGTIKAITDLGSGNASTIIADLIANGA